MTDKTQTEKPKLELSCREAQLVLNVIPPRKSCHEMKEEEIAAISHYLYCKPCRDQGLAEILGAKLSCQEAMLVWAEHLGALWMDCAPGFFISMETLLELYATEHVWGKYQWENSMGGQGYEHFTACQERPCRVLRQFWKGVPMSSSAGNGASGVIREFPLLIETFLEEGWPLNDLLAIQKQRLAELLKNIKNGKITVSGGHYCSLEELIAEVQEHFSALQRIVLQQPSTDRIRNL